MADDIPKAILELVQIMREEYNGFQKRQNELLETQNELRGTQNRILETQNSILGRLGKLEAAGY